MELFYNFVFDLECFLFFQELGKCWVALTWGFRFALFLLWLHYYGYYNRFIDDKDDDQSFGFNCDFALLHSSLILARTYGRLTLLYFCAHSSIRS